nr:reverse transcriptase domain-containing protein [Tanacetum cinerariifolium]
MSAMANTTLIVTTVTKPATNPRNADATLRVNIQDFSEEYYEDILPIIMDKVRRDKQKEVHASTGGMEGNAYMVLYVQLNPNRAARVWFDELPPKSVDSYKDLKTKEEMMITATAFIRGEAVAVSKKKGHTSWRTQDQSKRQTSKKEILAAEAGKFQQPPPMVTPVEKRRSNKFSDFHNDKGHNTDECMQLRKQVEDLVRAGKLSHLIKESKHRRDQSKAGKKEIPVKDNPTEIYMIQSWHIMTRKKVTQSFERVRKITFPPLTASSGVEGPLVIEAEVEGHMIRRIGSARLENFNVALHPDFPDQEVAIGGTLSAKGRTELCSILKENLDILAWQSSDMTGIPRSVAEHRLNIRERYLPVWQKEMG